MGCIESVRDGACAGDGGTMVIPVGRSDGSDQMMTIIEKTEGGVVRRSTLPVRFVPMVGGRSGGQ